MTHDPSRTRAQEHGLVSVEEVARIGASGALANRRGRFRPASGEGVVAVRALLRCAVLPIDASVRRSFAQRDQRRGHASGLTVELPLGVCPLASGTAESCVPMDAVVSPVNHSKSCGV